MEQMVAFYSNIFDVQGVQKAPPFHASLNCEQIKIKNSTSRSNKTDNLEDCLKIGVSGCQGVCSGKVFRVSL